MGNSVSKLSDLTPEDLEALGNGFLGHWERRPSDLAARNFIDYIDGPLLRTQQFHLRIGEKRPFSQVSAVDDTVGGKYCYFELCIVMYIVAYPTHKQYYSIWYAIW